MTLIDYLRSELSRMHGLIDKSLEDITEAQVHAVPGGHPKVNTLAWGVFHLVRTEDNIIRFVLQERRSPVWVEGGYAEKLGLPPVANGTGMSAEDAQKLTIRDLALWRDYQQKVWASTDDLFAKADAAFWDKTVTIKGMGEMPAWRAVSQICLAHGLMHVGQFETARTLTGAKPVINV